MRTMKKSVGDHRSIHVYVTAVCSFTVPYQNRTLPIIEIAIQMGWNDLLMDESLPIREIAIQIKLSRGARAWEVGHDFERAMQSFAIVRSGRW